MMQILNLHSKQKEEEKMKMIRKEYCRTQKCAKASQAILHMIFKLRVRPDGPKTSLYQLKLDQQQQRNKR